MSVTTPSMLYAVKCATIQLEATTAPVAVVTDSMMQISALVMVYTVHTTFNPNLCLFTLCNIRYKRMR